MSARRDCFSANRISLFLNHIQGIITAEGDNHIVQLKAARELLIGEHYTVPEAPAPDLFDASGGIDVFAPAALRYREAAQHQRLLESMQESLAHHGALYPAWNDCIQDATTLVRSHTERLVLVAFGNRIGVAEPAVADVLRPLWRLCAWEMVAGDAAFFLAEGMLAKEHVRGLSAELDQLCAEILPTAELLINAFGLPHDALRLPIAGDYLRAYDYRCDTHEGSWR